jgi:hypothetical protein
MAIRGDNDIAFRYRGRCSANVLNSMLQNVRFGSGKKREGEGSEANFAHIGVPTLSY